MTHHKTRVLLHAVALGIETVGTFFIFLDTLRLNARTPPDAVAIRDPAGYAAWYFHCAIFGFAMLFLGILIAGFCLFLEHLSVSREVAAPAPAEEIKTG